MIIEDKIREFIPFKQMGEILFSFTIDDLLCNGFFIPDWWEPYEKEPDEVAYKSLDEELTVYYKGDEERITNIQCFGLISYKGKLLTGLSEKEIINIFGEPDDIGTEDGAWFTDTDQETTISYYDYGGIEFFLRFSKMYSMSAGNLDEDD